MVKMMMTMMKTSIVLSWLLLSGKVQSQPSNDECTTATVIPSMASFPYTINTSGFLNGTESINEPSLSCYFYEPDFPSSTLFFSWTPSETGLYDFSTIGSTGSDRNNNVFPTIGILEGSQCDEVNEVVCGFQFLRGVELTAMTTYIIEIIERPYDFDENRIFGGNLVLTITPTPPAAPNDECADATVIPSTPSFPYIDRVNLARVTENLDDPLLSCNIVLENTDGKTIWYEWTPTTSGMYDFSAIGSTSVLNDDISADTFLGIYQGNTCSDMQELRCGQQRLRMVDIQAGTTYFIRLGTIIVELGNELILTVQMSTLPPPNDQCQNAIVVDPLVREIITGDTTEAFIDNVTDGFCGTFIEGPGLWYKTSNGMPNDSLSVVASTCNAGTTFDTKISVFTGSSCEDLVCVGGDDDVGGACGTSSTFSFTASALTEYWVLVHGAGATSTGNFSLTIDANPSFLALVDSRTNNIVGELGDVIDYSSTELYKASSANLNIQAIFLQTAVRSVRVTFDRTRRSLCEEKAPYAVFGDIMGRFKNATIPLGNHVVTATPYTQSGCAGALAEVALVQRFDVVGCQIAYNVYDASPVSTFFVALVDDMVIPALPCAVNINVVAQCGFGIGSVRTVLQNAVNQTVIQARTERENPYYLFGDRNGKTFSGSIAPGRYTLTSTIDGIRHPSLTFSVGNDTCV
jgi:hypothetical protein